MATDAMASSLRGAGDLDFDLGLSFASLGFLFSRSPVLAVRGLSRERELDLERRRRSDITYCHVTRFILAIT